MKKYTNTSSSLLSAIKNGDKNTSAIYPDLKDNCLWFYHSGKSIPIKTFRAEVAIDEKVLVFVEDDFMDTLIFKESANCEQENDTVTLISWDNTPRFHEHTDGWIKALIILDCTPQVAIYIDSVKHPSEDHHARIATTTEESVMRLWLHQTTAFFFSSSPWVHFIEEGAPFDFAGFLSADEDVPSEGRES